MYYDETSNYFIMARYDSDPVDPGDIQVEDGVFEGPTGQGKLFPTQLISSITQRAANSIDPRDMIQPIWYRKDENYKAGE